MEWTNEQAGSLDAVARWYKSGSKTSFYLAGYAGTGKTTLAKHFASHVDGTVMFGAFTGKAASVLRKKGCPGATTIHSLIYKPAGDSHGKKMTELENLIDREERKAKDDRDEKTLADWQRELQQLRASSRAVFELRDDAEITAADLVILDECSMIDRKMGKDLEQFGVPILYLGDPGQLPPVGGKGFLVDRRPDFMIEEITRQAKESAIIWAAHEIRQGRKIGYGTFGDGEVTVIPKQRFDWDLIMEADQVLTGKNTTRRNLNRAIRSRHGRTLLYPVKGDKLICLSNDHDEGLLNGVTCTALRDSEKRGNIITLNLDYEDERKALHCDPGHFEENYGRRVSFPRRDVVQHFDYGYTITGHKSQGSQWPHVAVCDDRMRVEDSSMRTKWLYTVVTRAEERLTVFA